MPTLKIWNVEDEIVLSDKSSSVDPLFDVLQSFNTEHNLFESGGINYYIRHNEIDDLIQVQDDLEDEQGNVSARYEIRG